MLEVTASMKLFITVTIEAETMEQAYKKFYSLYPKLEFENRGEIETKIISRNGDNIGANWEVSIPYYKGWD